MYTQLTTALKRLFKNRGLHYSEVARRIGLSESGLKKVLNAEDGSLGRLSELCTVANVTLAELLELAQTTEPWTLTDAQQDFFVAEPRAWDFVVALGARDWDLSAVVDALGLTRTEVERWLVKLENRGVLALRDGVVVPLACAGSPVRATSRFGRAVIRPLQDALLRQVRDGIETKPDTLPRECGMGRMELSAHHMAELRDELRELSERYARVGRLDRHRVRPAELHQVGLLTVMGPWTLDHATVRGEQHRAR
jgi:transcriptional regulator with XRE-family HTH domain